MVELKNETRPPRILIADDEEPLLDIMRHLLKLHIDDVQLTLATNGDQALEALRKEPFDVVISDQNMPGAQGLDVLAYCQEIKPDPPLFILVTAYGTIDMAVKAMRAGAHDFIKKPFENEEFVNHVRHALGTLELTKENRVLRQAVEAHYLFTEIVCASKVLNDVLDLARRAAEKASPVLVLGESGTGKDLLARAIHFHGPRARKPFIPINCGAIPGELMESEFFGHKRGAFTGAVATRRGCFEEVAGGTLLLDEIGEMPLDLQVKLLRVLEERKIRRIGENTEIPVDFRIIAATNQSLEEMVAKKTFRQDLYYRLNVLQITIPPLRERREDIVPLAENQLRHLRDNAESNARTFSSEALEVLYNYDYPGNVRELINILQRAVLLCDGETIRPEHLPPEITGNTNENPTVPEPQSLDLKTETRRAQRVVERRLIDKALKTTNRNHKQAAQLLGISRGSLYNKIQQIEQV